MALDNHRIRHINKGFPLSQICEVIGIHATVFEKRPTEGADSLANGPLAVFVQEKAHGRLPAVIHDAVIRVWHEALADHVQPAVDPVSDLAKLRALVRPYAAHFGMEGHHIDLGGDFPRFGLMFDGDWVDLFDHTSTPAIS